MQAGVSPYRGIAAAMLTGALLGYFVGALVGYFRLSSLIATLGMNFVLSGVIQIAVAGPGAEARDDAPSLVHSVDRKTAAIPS